MTVPGLLLAAAIGCAAAIGGTLHADSSRLLGDGESEVVAEAVVKWGATAAVFFLVLALLIWVVQ